MDGIKTVSESKKQNGVENNNQINLGEKKRKKKNKKKRQKKKGKQKQQSEHKTVNQIR